VAQIRADNIHNRLVATEWGGGFAANWAAAHPNQNYISTFDNAVGADRPLWAGLTWFVGPFDGRFPAASLLNATGTALTPLGEQYVSAFAH
jgi:hypothetical protein